MVQFQINDTNLEKADEDVVKPEMPAVKDTDNKQAYGNPLDNVIFTKDNIDIKDNEKEINVEEEKEKCDEEKEKCDNL